jgi:broad specificity phosphatase PhoE
VKVLLTRHGESEFSVRGLLNGDRLVPGPLTPAGREQALALGERLVDEPLDLCVTSALPRTIETADVALAGRHVPRLVDPELNDPLYGRFEGGRLDEYRRWATGEPSSAVPEPGGESRLEIVERYARAFRMLVALPQEHVLVVAHSLPISYALAARDGTPPAPQVPLASYAEPYPFTREELQGAAALLESWAASPTW